MNPLRLLGMFATAASILFSVQAASAQPAETTSAPSASTPYVIGSLTRVPLYLTNNDGRWSASLTGDLKDPRTERVEISLQNKAARVLAEPLPGGKRLCMTKMKERSEYGYLECNSAFFSVNTGSAVAGTVLRGILSLGILTVADAHSGNTAFTVSLDQAALGAAVDESKAIELARASAPLIEYREIFAKSTSSEQLRSFIAAFENKFDPEELVGKAKEKLPAALEKEEVFAKQRAAEAAQRVAALKQAEARRQAEFDSLAVFRSRLMPGDHVILNVPGGRIYFGMVVEVKQPLAYVQWDSNGPTMSWVRVDALTPPRK